MKGFWKSILSIFMAGLFLPVLAGYTEEQPNAEEETTEGQAQLVVLPSEERGNGVLKMSTSQELQTQSDETDAVHVVAETTPAGLPVNWILRFSGSDRDKPATEYVDLTLVNPVEEGGKAPWSNEIKLTVLERCTWSMELVVYLRDNYEISDTRTVIAEPLPEPETIETTWEGLVANIGDNTYENSFEVGNGDEIVILFNYLNGGCPTSLIGKDFSGEFYVDGGTGFSHTITVTFHEGNGSNRKWTKELTTYSGGNGKFSPVTDWNLYGLSKVTIKYSSDSTARKTLHVSIRYSFGG